MSGINLDEQSEQPQLPTPPSKLSAEAVLNIVDSARRLIELSEKKKKTLEDLIIAICIKHIKQKYNIGDVKLGFRGISRFYHRYYKKPHDEDELLIHPLDREAIVVKRKDCTTASDSKIFDILYNRYLLT